jgi:hypothetical protein
MIEAKNTVFISKMTSTEKGLLEKLMSGVRPDLSHMDKDESIEEKENQIVEGNIDWK